jgi:hypothetical protein
MKGKIPEFVITITGQGFQPLTKNITTMDWNNVLLVVAELILPVLDDGGTICISVVCDKGSMFASNTFGIKETYFKQLSTNGLNPWEFFANSIRVVVKKDIDINGRKKSIVTGRARSRWFKESDNLNDWVSVRVKAFMPHIEMNFEAREERKARKDPHYSKSCYVIPDRILVVYPFSMRILQLFFPDVSTTAKGFTETLSRTVHQAICLR